MDGDIAVGVWALLIVPERAVALNAGDQTTLPEVPAFLALVCSDSVSSIPIQFTSGLNHLCYFFQFTWEMKTDRK